MTLQPHEATPGRRARKKAATRDAIAREALGLFLEHGYDRVTLRDIAEQCDGVRCDMAMLMMNDVFSRTWGTRVGAPPADDYWPTIIPAVREAHPDFRFIAEAYWDLEWALQQQGFDFCYDKRLYDRLVVPAERALERRLQPRFGQSILCVAQVPERTSSQRRERSA